MADITNIPAQHTPFVPSVGQPTTLQDENRRLVDEEEAKKLKDSTTVHELIGAAAVQGGIGTIDRVIDSFKYDVDPEFYGKAFTDKRDEWVKRGVSEDQIPLADKAISAEHMDHLYDLARQNMDAIQTRAQFGIIANIAADFTDPVAFAAGAASGGLTYAERFGSIANAIRSGLVNTVQGVGMEAARGANDTSVTTGNLVATAAFSFGLGGAFGFRAGELGELAKVADDIAHNPKHAVNADPANDSFGSARVHGSHVDTMDGPMVDVKDWQQQKIDEAALVGNSKQTVFAKVRKSLSAVLGSNKDGTVANESRKALRDGVGYKDKNVAVEESASEMSLRLRDTEETKLRRGLEPLWQKYKQDNNLSWDYGKENFMDEAGRAMRDPSYKASPEAAAVHTHINKSTDAMWGHLHEAGVEGFEAPKPPHQNWLPRVYSAKGFINILQEKGLSFEGTPESVLEKLVKPAIRNAWEAKLQPGQVIDEDQLHEVAHAWLTRGYDRATQARTAQPGGLMHARDVDTVEQLLTDEGVTNPKAKALVEKLRNTQDETAKHSHAKHRIDMDESYKATLNDQFGNEHEVSIADLLENNVDKLTTEYIREMSGWAALKTKADVGTPRRLSEYKAWLNGRSIAAGSKDISRKLDIVYNSILGHSTEVNPGTGFARASRMVRSQSYLTTMLQVGPSMVEAFGTILGPAGFRNTMRAIPGSRAMLRRAQNGELELSEARFLEDIIAPGTDYLRNQPYLRIDDGVHYGATPGKGGKLLDGVENAMAYAKRAANVASGMAPVQAFLQRLGARGVCANLIEMANKGNLEQWKIYRLRNDGLTEEAQQALFARLRGKTHIDEIADDWDNWTPKERGTYAAYMWRVTHRAVTEGDVSDTMEVMHSAIGKIFWQFRGFMTSSYERSLLNGIHMRDWQTATMWSGSTLFAGVGMTARNYINTIGDPELRKKLLSPEEIAKQAFQQASYSSILPFMIDTVAHDMKVRKYLGDGKDQGYFSYGRSTGLEAGFGGIPTYSTAKAAWSLLAMPAKAAQGDVTKRDVKNAVKLLWFQNMFGVRNGISEIARQFPDSADE